MTSPMFIVFLRKLDLLSGSRDKVVDDGRPWCIRVVVNTCSIGSGSPYRHCNIAFGCAWGVPYVNMVLTMNNVVP